MTSELAKKECVPCKGGTPPLTADQVQAFMGELDKWMVEQEYHLTKSFEFRDFSAALDFVNRIGEIAEQQQHHPDIYLTWGKVRVDLWTHKIQGLTESDFILAARIDAALQKSKAD